MPAPTEVAWRAARRAGALALQHPSRPFTGASSSSSLLSHATATALFPSLPLRTATLASARAGAPSAAWPAALAPPAAAAAARGWAASGLARGAARAPLPSAAPVLPQGARAFSAAAGEAAAAAVGIAPPLVRGGAAAERQVFYWLAGCTGWVFSMVVLGGVTRLTRSGLSMTDWKFTGEFPPLNEEAWEAEFAKYKRSPEFRTVNSRMDVEEFKFIYFLEYAHRMWGRVLGVAFAVPCTYFAARGYITAPLAVRLGALFTLGGAQGLVGWWMVKSGLQEPKNNQVARVSPYRLAAHLTSAFVIYTGLLWTSLSVLYPAAPVEAALRSGTARARALLLPLGALIGVTAVSGAFVAGLDAGHAYNTFPLMGGRLVPAEYWDPQFETLFKNTFENTAAVQFHHRVLAVTTLASTTALWAALRNAALPARTTRMVTGMLGMAWMQVALGISTLLLYVPVSLGSAHQAGALTLMSFTIAAVHSVRGAGLAALRRAATVVVAPPPPAAAASAASKLAGA